MQRQYGNLRRFYNSQGLHSNQSIGRGNYYKSRRNKNYVKRSGNRRQNNKGANKFIKQTGIFEPRMTKIQKPAYSIRRNMLFLKGETLKLFEQSEIITGDIGVDRNEMVNNLIKGLDTKEKVQIAKNLVCTPVQQSKDYDIKIDCKKGKNSMEWLLTNYLIMLMLPQSLQLLYALLVDKLDINLIQIDKEDKEQLVKNIDEKKILQNLMLAKKYVSSIKEQHEKFYTKASQILESQETKNEIEKVFKIVGIKTVIHSDEDLGTAYTEMVKMLKNKLTCPYIENYNAPAKYYIKNRYWRVMSSSLQMYSPFDLISTIVAVTNNIGIWVANVYDNKQRNIFRNDLERWLSIYLNKEEKTDIMIMDSLMIAVPNIIC